MKSKLIFPPGFFSRLLEIFKSVSKQRALSSKTRRGDTRGNFKTSRLRADGDSAARGQPWQVAPLAWHIMVMKRLITMDDRAAGAPRQGPVPLSGRSACPAPTRTSASTLECCRALTQGALGRRQGLQFGPSPRPGRDARLAAGRGSAEYLRAARNPGRSNSRVQVA